MSEFRRCLTGLIEAQAERGGKTLLITPVSEADFQGAGNAWDRPLLGPYFRALDEVAEQTNTPLLDLLNQRWTQGRASAVLMRDPVHPTAPGHRLIARWIHAGLLSSGLAEGTVPSDLPKPGTKHSPF